jgi:glycosyltransferase involved in cell wall biosynthesis
MDVAHLTFRPPFASGSYNRLVGLQLEKIEDVEQLAISYWDSDVPALAHRPSYILVNQANLPYWKRVSLMAPERIRRLSYNGMGSRESIIYYLQIKQKLKEYKPKVIICYDGYKMGCLLRQFIDWPCRLVLSQHGLSYYLASEEAAKLYCLRSFDAIWSLTHASYRFDRSRISAYEPLVTVIPNGVDTDTFQPVSESEKASIRQRWSLPKDPIILLLLSRLVAKKGAHAILHSLKKVIHAVPNIYLWIVGGGDRGFEEHLRRMVDVLDIRQYVHFQGAIPPEQTALCYQASDVYLFPTLAAEGMGLSLMEAMACGLPCVASDYAAARECFTDNEVRFVPHPNIEDAFVNPVVELIQNDALRQRMGESARKIIQEHYDQEIMLENIREFFHRQLSLVRSS